MRFVRGSVIERLALIGLAGMEDRDQRRGPSFKSPSSATSVEFDYRIDTAKTYPILYRRVG